MGKRILSLCMALVLCVFVLPFPTLADGQDDALATLQAASDRGDTYPSQYKNAGLDEMVDEWNFYNRECTSFVAWCLNSRNGVAFHNWMGGMRWGHAKTWGTTAQALGYAVNNSPAVGSVAWSNVGDYGHVAWVSSVNGGQVTIEEYNYNYNGRFNSRTVSISTFTGYIHIQDIAAPATYKVEEGTYVIYSALDSKKCVDVAGRSTENGATIQLWEYHEPGLEKFNITRDGDGYRITNTVSGKCIDVDNGNSESGTNIQQWSAFENNPAQRWYFEDAGNGYVYIRSAVGTYMDVAGGASGNGTNIWAYSFNGSDAQKFKLAKPIYYLDVNGYFNGESLGNLGNYGTVDVYINGKLVADDVTDYFSPWPTGTTYEIKDIKAKSGYSYDGLKEGKLSGSIATSSVNVILKFSKIQTYTITFNANGGNVSPTSKSVTAGATYGDLPTPTWDGHKFDGWYTAASGGSQVTKDTKVTTTANQTLYAHWTALYYLDLNGCLDGVVGGNHGNHGTADVYINGKLVADDVKDYCSAWPTGTTYEIKDIKAKSGYSYDGVKEGKLTGSIGTATANVILTFSKIQTYTVTFNASGGNVSPTSKSVTGGATYGDLPTPTRDAYRFDGWYTEESGGSQVTKDTKVTLTANQTLYAHWKADADITLTDGTSDFVNEESARISWTACNNTDDSLTRLFFVVAYNSSGKMLSVQESEAVLSCGGNPLSATIGNCADSEITFKVFCLKPESLQPEANALTIRRQRVITDWVLASEAPQNAAVVANRWTYDKIETTSSTEPSKDGWEQTGFTWRSSGNGTHDYASYPSGFDTSHTLYTKYAKAQLTNSESGNNKRDVSDGTLSNYIYWHWTFVQGVLPNDNYNVFISDTAGVDGGRDYHIFRAFESTTDAEHTDSRGANGGDCFYVWNNDPQDGSWWWYRFAVYRQTYTDYEKLFSFRKVTKGLESTTEVSASDTITNVQHWVKYQE